MISHSAKNVLRKHRKGPKLSSIGRGNRVTSRNLVWHRDCITSIHANPQSSCENPRLSRRRHVLPRSRGFRRRVRVTPWLFEARSHELAGLLKMEILSILASQSFIVEFGDDDDECPPTSRSPVSETAPTERSPYWRSDGATNELRFF